MVHVTFYTTFSQRNVINKTLLYPTAANAELYDNTDVINPELKLAWNSDYVVKFNMFYIQEFKRYYFIDDVIAEPGGAARVKGSIDVLYTYHSSIGNDYITITRAQESKGEGWDVISKGTAPTYIKDSKLPVKPQRNLEVFEFTQQSPFNLNSAYNTWNFVLNVMGREPTN